MARLSRFTASNRADASATRTVALYADRLVTSKQDGSGPSHARHRRRGEMRHGRAEAQVEPIQIFLLVVSFKDWAKKDEWYCVKFQGLQVLPNAGFIASR